MIRLDVTSCDKVATGTGFLISPTLIATVAHVVANASTVRVTVPALSLAVTGTVIGFDLGHDLALVQASAPIPGHVFALDAKQPEIGTDMASIGFALGSSMSMTFGHITSAHNYRQVAGLPYPLSDMLLTDAAINPGNSGGPWLTEDGTVIALSESGPPFVPQTGTRAQGTNAGVPSDAASALVAQWEQSPQSPSAVSCPNQSAGTDPDSKGAVDTLWQYFYDIDHGDYASAYAQDYHATHPDPGLSAFVTGVGASQDAAADSTFDLLSPNWRPFDLVDTSHQGEELFADVTFESHQTPSLGPAGEACTDWSLRYWFIKQNGLWLIQRSGPAPGVASVSTACPVPSTSLTPPSSATSSTSVPGT